MILMEETLENKETENQATEAAETENRPVATDQNSYKNIMKRISAFGGVQIFGILINLVRGKFVALLLGPEGMGLSSILTSSTTTVQQLGSLGLNLALVKEVAAGKESREQLPAILAVGIRLIYFTAILSCLLCLLLSPLLSFWSFGNYDYTLGFGVLSAGVGLSVAGTGYLALLQGLGEVKRLAWASVVGGISGLVFGIPLYYYLGLNGIVPALLIFSLIIFVFYFISFRRSVTFDKVKLQWKERRPLVKKLISLGVVLMIGSLVGTLTNYIINIFIRAYGSLDNVGLFQAANSLTNQYVGIVFSALALDYFPRLSAVAKDHPKMNEVVNRQLEIVILLVTPLILILFLATPLVIEILLSEEFLVVIPLMRWLAYGVLLQAVSFPLGYMFVACDNKKVYVWVEVVTTNILWIVCSVVFYYYFDLIGLGISLVVRTIIDLFIVFIVTGRSYGFRVSGRVGGILAVCLILGTAGFISSFLPPEHYVYIITGIILLSAGFSLLQFRKGISRKSI